MPAANRVRAWRPQTAGIREVFWAEFTDHAYPMHTHDSWTVLTIETGAVRYALDRREHGALTTLVTVLPPHVAHDGQAAQPSGFRKRVLYLEPATLGERLIGSAVDRPEIDDAALQRRIGALHRSLAAARDGRADGWETDSRLALVTGRLRDHLTGDPERRGPVRTRAGDRLADGLRALLDADPVAPPDLVTAGRLLGADPRHLVRTFSARFGLPPHRYLTGVRVDRARRLLLAGVPAADAATGAGFYDQSHLARHLRTMIDTTPGRYAGGIGRSR
ncbi:AraC-like DNA-binding protein [Friedmanniella endophytica]|uniref:AraC-like DNA-binding protein n=1 Tax=Microlunatus kandeliicorticis TaxID=1759536 RepID=A0A7W3IVH9_9ACTN|nr:AraC family transcriptional regulator [Microlunatus kandeliicorticis]MBA8796026.1 AraC-like DNA-binding protein [Microlunatus kandeliicorticis]